MPGSASGDKAAVGDGAFGRKDGALGFQGILKAVKAGEAEPVQAGRLRHHQARRRADGGHGTAAAIGESFAAYGVEEMQSLAMTSATVGIVASVVIGMWLISWGASRGKTSYICKFENLSPELRTGILPPDKRKSMGMASFSAISLDSMTFNFAVIAMVALGGWGLANLIALAWPALMLPVFSCAFIVGILVKWVMSRVKVDEHISKPILGHLSGAFTDYLVAVQVIYSILADNHSTVCQGIDKYESNSWMLYKSWNQIWEQHDDFFIGQSLLPLCQID